MYNNNSCNHNNQALIYKPLPPGVSLPTELGKDACKWLDDYVEFASLWSPRSYRGYHYACGLWILSTVAAGRVVFDFGKQRKTNLCVLLIGRSTMTAKSSAANIAIDVLRTAGLDSFLLPNTCTPQKMINLMSNHIPNEYDSFSEEKKKQVNIGIAFSGQRGWFYEEFGQLLSEMKKKEGVMSDFSGLLRRFDDNLPRFENATMSRNIEVVNQPYLAFLGCLTPDDIKPYARGSSHLWGDGFLARFLLVAPPSDFYLRGQYPKGKRIIPDCLINPLKNWHEYLGIPKFTICETSAICESKPSKTINIPQEVRDAYYRYDDGVAYSIKDCNNHDLDGNNGRSPEMALRIAALFASLEGNDSIELKHLAKGQTIIESCRRRLYDLYGQLNDYSQTSTLSQEQKVLTLLSKRKKMSKRDFEIYGKFPAPCIEDILSNLMHAGNISSHPEGKTTYYQLKEKEDSL